jgi:DNA-binding MarR family transcriptional regulator
MCLMRDQQKARVNYQALAEFRYEIRRFLSFSEQAARSAGVEPHQHQALLIIKGLPDNKPATVGRLAHRLQIRHHSAVELADRLEKKKLIRRVRSSSDGRTILLVLTPRGERKLEKLVLLHRDELSTAAPRLLRALVSVASRTGRGQVRKSKSVQSKGKSIGES